MIKPVVGEDVYIPSSFYLGHGIDDFRGGLCKINRIQLGKSGGEETLFVEVQERLGTLYNWNYIRKGQRKWKREYGKRRGFECPDFRSEFNEW